MQHFLAVLGDYHHKGRGIPKLYRVPDSVGSAFDIERPRFSMIFLMVRGPNPFCINASVSLYPTLIFTFVKSLQRQILGLLYNQARMYSKRRKPDSITPSRLDEYLANGWFRHAQQLFSKQFKENFSAFDDVIWLRHRLADFDCPSSFFKLLIEPGISYTIGHFDLTTEYEWLYQTSRGEDPLPSMDSLENILLGEACETIFDTRIIRVLYYGELVGAGFFDVGETSVANIIHFADPALDTLPIEHFLFYLTAQYAKAHGKTYLYTGYFLPNQGKSSCKLDYHRNSLEYFNAELQAWYPFRMFRDNNLPLGRMQRKLEELVTVLGEYEINAKVVANSCFSMNSGRHNSPFLVYIDSEDGFHGRMITFNTLDLNYYVFDTFSVEEDEIVDRNGHLYLSLTPELAVPVEWSPSPDKVAAALVTKG